MAFDRPLEADKIDDLGLFSSLIRGPIMWMIGGSSTVRREQEKEKVATKNVLLNNKNGEIHYLTRQQYSHESDFMNAVQSPNRLSSDISDEGDSSDTSSSDEEPNALPVMINMLNLHPTNDRHNKSLLLHGKDVDHTFNKKTRTMSWSDESGQDLVQICDESKKPMHDHCYLAHAPSHKPIKSAIKRSLSSRDSMSNKPNFQPSHCVPSGLVGGKNGINIPTSSVKNSNGCISPQWGWYISTTPPTPERYCSKKIKSLGNSGSIFDGNEIVQRNNSIMNGSKTPIFTREIKGIPKNVSGWPSVPF